MTEGVRKVIKGLAAYKTWIMTKAGHTFDFCFDSFLMPSPYASSFAGFVEFSTSMWFGGGGVLASLWNAANKHLAKPAANEEALPEDMSILSLVGGGLIAGDSIAALVLGVLGLLSLMN